jgi:hypothetical protein
MSTSLRNMKEISDRGEYCIIEYERKINDDNESLKFNLSLKEKYKKRNYIFLTKFMFTNQDILQNRVEKLKDFSNNKKIYSVLLINKNYENLNDIVTVLIRYDTNILYAFLMKNYFDLDKFYKCDHIFKLFSEKFDIFLLKFEENNIKYEDQLKRKNEIESVKNNLKEFNFMFDSFLLKDGILFLKRDDMMLYKIKYL